MTDKDDKKVVPLRAGHQPTSAQAEVIRGSGLLDSTTPAFEDMDIITAPVNEANVIGTLTQFEAELFANYLHANKQCEALAREIDANTFYRLGDRVRNGEDLTNAQHGVEGNEENLTKLHALARRVEALRALFSYLIGERFGAHEYGLGIRTGRRVEKMGRKF